MNTLRDGSLTMDPRCDRLINFDERSRQHGVLTAMPDDTEIKTVLYPCEKVLDQGREGACVGFGNTHALIAHPYDARGLDNTYAKEQVYWPAQRIDNWRGGSYPGAWPKYEGTDVLSGLKILQKLQWIKSYHAAFSLREIKIGLQKRPAVCGIQVYEGLMTPDEKHFVHNTGEIVGGHCICLLGWNEEEKFFTFINSWGSKYGDHGLIYMKEDEFDALRKQQGEFFFFDLWESY